MKPYKLFFCLVLLVIFLEKTQSQYVSELADFLDDGKFSENTYGDIIPSLKANYYFHEDNSKIKQYSFENGEEIKILADYLNDSIFNFGIPEGFEISPDEKRILFYFEKNLLYRYSFYAKYFVFNLEDKSFDLIADTGLIRDAKLSPNGQSVAFVKENNLYVQNFQSDEIKQITFDGKLDTIINGAPDWVYEEEFLLKQAFKWSPDGKYIAFLKFNESLVREYELTFYDEDNYPVQKTYKYPKAGENNSVVEPWVYNIETNKTVKIDVGNDSDFYLPRFCWTKQEGKLAIVKLNRLQNELQIKLASANNGKSELVYIEKDKKYIDEIPKNYPLFINKDNDFLITSEISGFRHIYLKRAAQEKILAVTRGNFEVNEILGFDEKNENVYYVSNEKSPLISNIYKISLNKGISQMISPFAGQSEAVFNYDYSSFVLKCNDSKHPQVEMICHLDGKASDTLNNNENVREDVVNSGVPLKEFFQIKTKNEILNAWMLKPLDFNAKKKYPVLFYVYGGPGVQTVLDNWKINWLNYMAMQGYIIVSVDNRGTGGRGAKFRNCTYANLGLLEVEDQIEAAKYMASLPYVDSGRIGIYGWSYGGYLASMCIMQGAEVFKAAISVASPVHWKFYDSVYSERYMDLPSNNPAGYESSSVLSYTPLLKGKFLLIHGMTDDNVHIQNSMVLIDALVRDNKTFETFMYPNKSHSLKGGNTRLHLYSKMTEFLKKNL